jgi:hypothetical protein
MNDSKGMIMSKTNNPRNHNDDSNDETDNRQDIYDTEITSKDYGFIVGPDGNLKSVFMPTDYFDIPENVREVFKLFGINEPEQVMVHSIH